MFWTIILPIFSNIQFSVPEDGQNNCPKHVELTGIINEPLLLHLGGCLYYLYQSCTVKQISDNEIYLLFKYIKSVLWRVAKRLSYIEDGRCLKVNTAYSWFIFQFLIHYFLHLPPPPHATRSPPSHCNKRTTELCTHPFTLLQLLELFFAIGALLKLRGNRNRIQHWKWPHSVSVGRANLLVEYLFELCSVGQDGVVGFGDGILIGSRFSEPVHAFPGVHPSSYTVATGSLCRGKAARAWRWPPTPSSAEVTEIAEL